MRAPRVLVLGGTGFVGRQVCEQLARLGWHITVPTRRASQAAGVQTLPGLTVLETRQLDEGTLAHLMAGHDAVVHLIAVLHGDEERFEQVHVQLPRRIAAAMQATGVRRLVHVSALGADLQGPSMYQRSKARGETVLHSAGLQLTVLRPSVIFGADDRFLNLFARLQKTVPVMLLAGAEVRMQPVWVGDVARAVVHCLQHPATAGMTFELAGPRPYTLRELVSIAGRLSGHERPVIGLPLAFGYLQALALQCLPGEPLMSTDNVGSLERDNVPSGHCPGLADMGIAPAPLEPIAAAYLDTVGQADPLLGIRQSVAPRRSSGQ